MSRIIKITGILCILLASHLSFSQDTTAVEKQKIEVIKNDGVVYTGFILTDDGREILLESDQVGLIYIPKLFIKEIKKYEAPEVVEDPPDEIKVDTTQAESHSNDPVVQDPPEEDTTTVLKDTVEFINNTSTKYILTDNAFPLRKGEAYIKLMLLAVEVGLPVTKNWSIGGFTTYWGFPAGIKTKYTWTLSENAHVSADLAWGTMAFGAGEWGMDDGGFIASSTLTMGDRKRNFSVKLGYNFIHERWNDQWWDEQGNLVTFDERWEYHHGFLVVSGMTPLSEKAQLIGEVSFAAGSSGIAGSAGAAVRFSPNKRHHWQIGGSLFTIYSTFIPIPFPHLSYTYVFPKRKSS